jgi:hypothetical protein
MCWATGAVSLSRVQYVTIDYKPRDAFLPYHASTKRFGLSVAHRRAGKTVARINKIIRSAIECRKQSPRFGYGAPTYIQAKDIAWLYLKHYTAPMLDIGLKVNESELSVVLPHNGAQIRLYGLENYDRLRGLYFDGLAIDEAQDVPPVALTQVILPALSDRNGWLDASGTPKGRAGLLYKLYQDAQAAPAEWFVQILKASETGILEPDQLAMLKRTMPPNEYEQEMECSFDAAVTGAYYAKLIAAAEADKRLTVVPYDPAIPVSTAWDLGVEDKTTIVMWQQPKGGSLRIIDYYEASGYGLDHYAQVLDKRGYKYGKHYAPHDIAVRELGTGKSRLEAARALGITFVVLPAARVEDGINAVRMMLPRCWIDASKCTQLVESLRLYREKIDDKRQVSMGPLHDVHSHAADAIRYMAMALRDNDVRPKLKYPDLAIP